MASQCCCSLSVSSRVLASSQAGPRASSSSAPHREGRGRGFATSAAALAAALALASAPSAFAAVRLPPLDSGERRSHWRR